MSHRTQDGEFSKQQQQKKTEQGFPSDSVVKNHLPVQGTWVGYLILEDPTGREATKRGRCGH